MHDQIDKFKEYISQNQIKNNAFISIPILTKSDDEILFDSYPNHIFSAVLSLIEACAYFGSINIFFFLLSNQKYTISKKCLRYAIIGRNTDIINECLKENQMDLKCLRNIVCSHNHQMLEFVLDRNLFTYKDFDGKDLESRAIYEDIIKYQNLKAVFLLFEKEKNCIVPWCAAFPQTLEILKNEKLPDKTDFRERNILHYACMSQNSDIFKFLVGSIKKIDVKYHMTALCFAAEYNNIDAVKILISHGANVNAKHYYITLYLI